MQHRSLVDVAIVEAGAAGLAAARELRLHGLSVLVLEARNRADGRATTKRLDRGIVFHVRCEWLHSADINSSMKMARDYGFDVVSSPPHCTEHSYRRDFLNRRSKTVSSEPERIRSAHRAGGRALCRRIRQRLPGSRQQVEGPDRRGGFASYGCSTLGR
ncbi:FAD-dependent oxidoreductase [Bradyrhizobium sp. CCGB12]|uniref:FAD-dependent oxidoreductase n=1 Tax=Bradyrhizobium sp. CCGB12 TaxID=2949632 RepID=UPI0020B3D266|nr:FAD-dependent oxidoreductase [Bradyrhizobium sp. CCGB12]MCP3395516.1 FAD-dependent oxidoreductase [Bradyrhizobium sp. CCGB12]